MPHLTERQEDANALLNAFIVHLLAQMEADAFRAGANLESDSGSSDLEDGNDPITEGIIKSIEELYKERYAGPQRNIPKTQENLHLLLDNYHQKFPDIFRSYIHITPECFDDLVNSIKDHPIFHNNSNNPQMPIEEQVAVALYQFGHYGEASGLVPRRPGRNLITILKAERYSDQRACRRESNLVVAKYSRFLWSVTTSIWELAPSR